MKNAAAKQHFSKPTEPLTGNVLYQREVGRETTARTLKAGSSPKTRQAKEIARDGSTQVGAITTVG